ncbi:hypothetical protein E3Q08_01615 [Wallemia mellicola]|uniref:Uncharacterized protein n=1 Tax=Wallemia mellicola TaxID=1708541 RepID=A0AB38MZB9_9BASI|nr:hypothetical protein E3Q24_02562 [Wallemia mellicola]TIB87457.1 hypothetical protein E3Q21_01283 [Wallemia mellicola]TIB90307.1 hypothetical protein E3Q20_01270 [Wallemia mellicola]TIC36460.1 hypothetical protein E3Q09_01320 [Wallemia mellicola]TIC42123.1 hypothetical protein E3Q07_01258 [Wallemia mellicola]
MSSKHSENTSNTRLENELRVLLEKKSSLKSKLNDKISLEDQILKSLSTSSENIAKSQTLHCFRSLGLSAFDIDLTRGRWERSRTDILKRGLAIRIETFLFDKFWEPYYVILAKSQDSDLIRVAHHTIPHFIDLQPLGDAYLGWSPPDSSVYEITPRIINPFRFVSELQRALVAYIGRREKVKELQDYVDACSSVNNMKLTANDGYRSLDIVWEIGEVDIRTKIMPNEEYTDRSYKRYFRLLIEYELFSYELYFNIGWPLDFASGGGLEFIGGDVTMELIIDKLPSDSLLGHQSAHQFRQFQPQLLRHCFMRHRENKQELLAKQKVQLAYEQHQTYNDIPDIIERLNGAISDGDLLEKRTPKEITINAEVEPAEVAESSESELEDEDVLPLAARTQYVQNIVHSPEPEGQELSPERLARLERLERKDMSARVERVERVDSEEPDEPESSEHLKRLRRLRRSQQEEGDELSVSQEMTTEEKEEAMMKKRRAEARLNKKQLETEGQHLRRESDVTVSSRRSSQRLSGDYASDTTSLIAFQEGIAKDAIGDARKARENALGELRKSTMRKKKADDQGGPSKTKKKRTERVRSSREEREQSDEQSEVQQEEEHADSTPTPSQRTKSTDTPSE